MSEQLEQTIDTAQKLTPSEQIELVKTLLENLLNYPLEKIAVVDTLFRLLRQAFYRFSLIDEETRSITESQTTSNSPRKSLLGMWEGLGISVTENDISEARHEMWGDFAERNL